MGRGRGGRGRKGRGEGKGKGKGEGKGHSNRPPKSLATGLVAVFDVSCNRIKVKTFKDLKTFYIYLL